MFWEHSNLICDIWVTPSLLFSECWPGFARNRKRKTLWICKSKYFQFFPIWLCKGVPLTNGNKDNPNPCTKSYQISRTWLCPELLSRHILYTFILWFSQYSIILISYVQNTSEFFPHSMIILLNKWTICNITFIMTVVIYFNYTNTRPYFRTWTYCWQLQSETFTYCGLFHISHTNMSQQTIDWHISLAVPIIIISDPTVVYSIVPGWPKLSLTIPKRPPHLPSKGPKKIYFFFSN